MRKFANTLALLAAVMLPIHANAAYSCNVNVKYVLVYGTGMVNVLHSGASDWTMICSLTADYGGVSVSTCSMWTAMLLAIKKKNGTATFYYDGTGSCATLPTYGSAPIPIYIGDMTP